MAIILRSSTEFGSFGAHYAKVVEDRPIRLLSAKIKYSPKNLVLAIYELERYCQRFLRTNSLDRGTPCQKQ